MKIIDEKNEIFKTTVLCEPQMSKRGLYPNLSKGENNQKVKLMMNFLSFCDGQNSLLQIAEKINVPIWELFELTDKLKSHNLIKKL